MKEATARGFESTKVEQVNIVFTKTDDQNSVLVVPGKFFIKLNDQVEWKCASGGFSVDFNGANGSPFGESHYQLAGKGSILSGPATTSGEFKYTVTVDGNVLDPSGKVDP